MEIYNEIMNYFGYRNQMKKLNEECYEFLEAVDNYEDLLLVIKDMPEKDKSAAREFVIEEMADMLILITQFIAKYDIKKGELDKYMDYKIDRTLRRIDEKYYDKDEEINK